METANGKRQKANGKRQALSFSFKAPSFLHFCLLPFAFCLLLFCSLACRSRALLDQAQQSFDNRDYTGAINQYEEFLKKNPNHEQAAFAHFQLGNIYLLILKDKQYDKAVTQYVQVIESSPRSPYLLQARQRLAKSYAGLNKRREAITEYENLLKVFPETPDRRRVRLDIADLYFDQNDLSQARVEYEKVTKDAVFDSLTERAWLQIGGVCVLLNDLEDAIPAYVVVVAKSSDSENRRRARLLLADCYQRTLQFEEAIKTLEQTDPDPKNPDDLKRRIAAIHDLQKQRGLP